MSDVVAQIETESNVTTTITEEAKCTIGEPSLKFLQLISIFESEESDRKKQSLSQGKLSAVEEETELKAGTTLAPAADETTVDHSSCAAISASGVAVTNYTDGGWTERPKRNLLVVINPWCMLRKSGPDRQSEFPPPGFLERLKAKLLALHRNADEHSSTQPAPAAAVAATHRRRPKNNQKINYWVRYMSAIRSPGRPCVKNVKTTAAAVHQNEPPLACVDFLEARRRFASIAAEFEKANGWQKQKIPLQ